MPKISIGLPIYNGEKFLCTKLETILSQTFHDFELIISDNASTDLTAKICEEFIKNDSRIKYTRQKKFIHGLENFSFVLEQAKSEFFVWTAADDIWEPKFLEKNIEVLEEDKNIIGSISDVKFFYIYDKNLNSLLKKLKNENRIQFEHCKSAYGDYSQRLKIFLKLRQATSIYAVFRTKNLKKSFSRTKEIYPFDFAIILDLLQYGNFHVLDELLMFRYGKGISSKLPLEEKIEDEKISLFEIILPNLKFTIWCWKNFGLKNNIKNGIWILRYFIQGETQFIIDLVKIIKKKLS